MDFLKLWQYRLPADTLNKKKSKNRIFAKIKKFFIQNKLNIYKNKQFSKKRLLVSAAGR
jgi:hypothetical protein